MALPGDPEEFVVKAVSFTARRGGDLGKEAGGWRTRLRGRRKKGRRRRREGFSVEKTFDLKFEAAQSSGFWLSLQCGGYVSTRESVQRYNGFLSTRPIISPFLLPVPAPSCRHLNVLKFPST